MTNPFELIETRLSNIELLLLDIKHQPANSTPNEPELLTIEQVTELLYLSKPTIYTKVSRGELPGVCKRGKRLFFNREIILNWLKEGRMLSNAEIEAEAGQYLQKRRAN